MSFHECQPELIARAVGGDRRALEELLLAHSVQLSMHVAARLPKSVRGVLAAEDILQQTFLRAFQQINGLEQTTERSFSAWLKTIAENQLHDAVKGLKRKKRGGSYHHVCRLAGQDASSMTELVDLLSGRHHTPGRSVARREAVRAIQVGIAALPDDQREAVRQHLLEGKSLAETAAAMGRSPSSVSGLIYRAKKRLRDALGRASLWLSTK